MNDPGSYGKSILSMWKASLLKITAFVLFYLGMLRLLTYFVNIFQAKRNKQSKLVFPFVTKRRSRNLQILVYHKVNDDRDPFFPAIPIDVFAKQMDYFASNFNVCSLESAIEGMEHKDVPDNAVVVTFDDGYKDNYVNAFPILRRLSIPATIFLATDAISSGKVLWHDRVFAAFRETKVSFLKGFNENSGGYPLRTLEEKLFGQQHVLKLLRSLNGRERSLWLDQLIDRLEVEDRKETSNLMLTWDEVGDMQQGGISFGSHSVTHPILSRLSIDEARIEICESKRIIEERLGVRVRSFAYPSGRKIDFNEKIKDILREAGYSCALTMIFGANEIGQDLFEFRRGEPWEQDLPTFAMKFDWYKFCG